MRTVYTFENMLGEKRTFEVHFGVGPEAAACVLTETTGIPWKVMRDEK